VTRRRRAGVGPHLLDRTQPNSNAKLRPPGPRVSSFGEAGCSAGPVHQQPGQTGDHDRRAVSPAPGRQHDRPYRSTPRPPSRPRTATRPAARTDRVRAGRDVDDRPDAPVVAASNAADRDSAGTSQDAATVGLGFLTVAAERTRHERILLVSHRRCLPYARGWIRSAPDRREVASPGGPAAAHAERLLLVARDHGRTALCGCAPARVVGGHPASPVRRRVTPSVR
jgi:hypothetical protein